MAQEGSQGAVYITPIGASDSKEMKVLSMSESSILRYNPLATLHIPKILTSTE